LLLHAKENLALSNTCGPTANLPEVANRSTFFTIMIFFQDGIQNNSRNENNHQTRDHEGRSQRPESFAAAVNAAPRVSATYVKSSRNGRTITGSREVTV